MSWDSPRRTDSAVPVRKIPVKVHRNVSLLRVEEPILIDEILARKSLARLVVGRLSETVVLVRLEDEDAILDELRKLGHAPRIVR